MRLRNFALGINSYPASSPGSNHTTARDVLNLRVDGDGYLRLAPGVERWQEFSSRVTGVAKAHDHLFILLEDGNLYRIMSDNSTLPELVGSTEMRGKLSIIDEFETFFLITSSDADDPGYHYDVENGVLTPLDFMNIAVRPTTAIELKDTIGKNLAWGDHDEATIRGTEFRIYYLFVEYDENHAIGAIGGPVSAEGWFLSAQIKNSKDDTNSFTIKFNGFSVSNPNTTHVRVYRALFHSSERRFANPTFGTWYDLDYDVSEPSFTHTAGFGNVDDLTLDDFKFIKEIPKNRIGSTFEDDALEAGESLSQLHIISGLSPTVRKWVHFNGRNFLAGDNAMKFSDVQFGVLLHSVYRAANSIQAPGRTEFVEVFDETLVFGDASHLNVLRGYDPYNYQVYQVASVGPVGAYAGNVLPSGGFGFIAQDGFYVFDGERVKEISTPQLDRFFENRVAVDGAVLPLPNSESLWSVEFDDLTRYTFLLNLERLDAPIWTRLSAAFDQGTSYPLAPLGRWVFTDDGEWVFDEDTPWGFTDPNAQPLQRIFLARDVALVEEYLWYDLDSGIRADNEWFWESNLMRGGSETVKVYDRLTLAGDGENPIDVDFNLAIKGETVTKEIRAEPFTKNSRKKRIPIKRRANGLTFKISGYGDVLLRWTRCRVRGARV